MMVMNTIIFQVQDAQEGGYNARAINHCIYTEARTWPELEKNLREAVACHFDEGVTPLSIQISYRDKRTVISGAEHD
jgi:hypothetical protein